MKHLLKFYRYAFAWENYLLLARSISAAWLVRQCLPEQAVSPHFASALAAVEHLYLPPQPGWKISDEAKIARFAGFVVRFPFEWGQCVQQSLIAYRLLNGYGIPAKVCFGVSRNEAITEGHAWIVKLNEPDCAFAEAADPRERFTIVYASSLPVMN
ncbi:MAG: lasso peptide biosynthesis B2 protein [Acidobacteriota bacterium]